MSEKFSFSRTAIKRMAKSAGASRLSEDSYGLVDVLLEADAERLISAASEVATNSGRKRINAADVQAAILLLDQVSFASGGMKLKAAVKRRANVRD